MTRVDSLERIAARADTGVNKKPKPGYKPSEMRIVVATTRDEPKGSIVFRGAKAITMKDREIIENAQHEEFKHFGMALEFLLRRKPRWRETLQGILFQPGDIVERGERAEEESD